MGFSCSFVAVKGRTSGEVAELLGWALTEQVDTEWYTNPGASSLFGRGSKKLSIAELPTGWTLVADPDWSQVTPERLRQVSREAEVIAWTIEERVMVSQAWGYRDSAEVWMIEYDPEKWTAQNEPQEWTGQMITRGELPACFAGILEDAEKKQQAEDPELESVSYLYDVPADVCAALCGFRHDGEGTLTEEPIFYRLRSPDAGQPEKKRGLLATLFGRG